MKVDFTLRAEDDLANQFDYGVLRFGRAAAERTLRRVDQYVRGTLAKHPRLGLYHSQIDAYESWIPKTPFVIFYRLDEAADRLVVLALYHHAQDRSEFDPD